MAKQFLESSPIHYASSSSPTRAANGNLSREPEVPTSSSGLFIRSSRSTAPGASGLNNSRRADLHNNVFGSTPSRRRRLFVDENGMPAQDGELNSDSRTFSNVDPNTSEAERLGGSNTRYIWGTNINIQDVMAAFRDFLLGFQKKYRMWVDGATEEETSQPDSGGNEKQYMQQLKIIRELGVIALNLDLRDLKAYPTTIKLWHQLLQYPEEIIPLMDQTIKDVMVDQAEEEMNRLRQEQQRNRPPMNSSTPAMPTSEANEQEGQIPDLLLEAETRNYKVKPFGLDKSVNMRELNPNGKQLLLTIFYLSMKRWPSGRKRLTLDRHGQDYLS